MMRVAKEILEVTARQYGFEMMPILINMDALVFKCPGAWPVTISGLELHMAKDPIDLLIRKLKQAGISLGPKKVEA